MHMLLHLLLMSVIVLRDGWALILPKRHSSGLISTFSVSSACTTNISIPTVSDSCISTCRIFQEAQLRCRDHSTCMCKSASSTDLQSCLTCIIDDIGDFAHVIPDFIGTSRLQVTHYASACNATRPSPLSTSETAASLSGSNDSLDSCSQAITDNLMMPSRTRLGIQPSLFLLLTLVTSLVLLFVACVYPCFHKEFGIL